MARDAGDPQREGTLVPWRRVGRRLARMLAVAIAVVVVGTALTWGAAGEVTWARMSAWAGVAALLLLAGVVVVVGGSALRGMLRAGDRGERLAGGDVGLLPPQVRPRQGAEEDPVSGATQERRESRCLRPPKTATEEDL